MNRSRKDIEIAEPTTFDEGNNRFMNMVNPDLIAVEWVATIANPAAFHGAKQNGVQVDPLNPPPNLTITTDALERFFAGQNHTQEFKTPYDKITQFKNQLESKKAGDDAWDAWVWIVDYCQASPTADKTTFLNAFAAADFATYQGYLIKAIGFVFDISGYLPMRNAINTQTRARLVGEDTEVVEVWE